VIAIAQNFAVDQKFAERWWLGRLTGGGLKRTSRKIESSLTTTPIPSPPSKVVVRAEARAKAEAKAESLAHCIRGKRGPCDGRIRAGGGTLLRSDERDREVANEPAPSMRP
jgi:hypothetical protein